MILERIVGIIMVFLFWFIILWISILLFRGLRMIVLRLLKKYSPYKKSLASRIIYYCAVVSIIGNSILTGTTAPDILFRV